ncbi:MAG TPA: nitrate- and nitrite sensing domain-containing protein [Streptosporangiaceae bacterium]|nr:nitrate- and nitrite sensing domain-containing protein [Streptosporangiaceae bacterium]
MPTSSVPDHARIPLLARLKVGTKLMLLVLLPVGVLLGFTTTTAVADWQAAGQQQDFRTATQLSFATAAVADQLAGERTAAAMLRLRPGAQARAALRTAQRDVDQALSRARAGAAGRPGSVDAAGHLAAVSRQLVPLRLRVAGASLPVPDISGSYGALVTGLISTIGELIQDKPPQSSGRAADACLAILQAVEAAQRERVDVAASLAAPRDQAARDQLIATSRWATLEDAELGTFRQNASGRLVTALDAVLSAPAGIEVRNLLHDIVTRPRTAIAHTSLGTWLSASGTRIDGLRRVELGAAGDLATTTARDLQGTRAADLRNLGVSLAVLVLVTAFGLVVRRSITGPLSEVSEGARTLSGGDLDFDVRYVGRDEIGDVAAAFRDLHVTAERLVGEIRATNAAIIDNRLDHRADAGAFEGTWAQLMAGMNGTIDAFAQVHGQGLRAERELEGIFNLSLDLLCIVGQDGSFKRVNPAFERTLGYAGEELLARPLLGFVHPDDRTRTQGAHDDAIRGADITGFENRYIRSDGAERWLQWSARSVPEEGLIYATARDVTDVRRAGQEQDALRRVATLVAKRAPPAGVFDAVVTEMHQLLDAEDTRLLRYEPDHTVTVVAARSEPGMEIPLGTRYSLEGNSVAVTVRNTGRPARLDHFAGPPGSTAETLIRMGIRSAAGAPILVEERLWGVMIAAWTDRQPAAGIEDRIAQFTDLVATAISNAQARADLAASRARIVAASDQTRRRIERDLHDGAQQRLVSLGLALRAAQRAVPAGQPELERELAQVSAGLTEVLEELREMSRGIHPAILSLGGLGAALKALARRSPVPVQLDVQVRTRLPEHAEVAAYFVVSEALANVAKHAQASVVGVRVEVREGVLHVSIHDDGTGGADPSRGSGLIGLSDRVEASGGTISISSQPGQGTRITAELPVGDS